MAIRRFFPSSLWLVALLAALLLPRIGGAETPEPNLLRNSDFADGMNDWGPVHYGKEGTIALDPEEVRHGQPALRIESPGDMLSVQQTVKVKAHTTYLLSADIKVKEVQQDGGGGAAGADVMMAKSPYASRNARGTADWQRMTTQLNTDDKTEIQVGPALGCGRCRVTGTAWFSHVTLTELGHDGPDSNLLANANFERGERGWELIDFGQDDTLTLDPKVLHNGKPTLRVEAFGEMTFARQIVSVKAHTTYRLSGYVKVKDVRELHGDDRAGANLIVGSTLIASRAISGTADWQEISTEFETEDATVIRVGPAMGFYGRQITGTGWFSGLSLAEVERNPPER